MNRHSLLSNPFDLIINKMFEFEKKWILPLYHTTDCYLSVNIAIFLEKSFYLLVTRGNSFF